ncbi:MAG TPA: hypothetical protein VGR72_01565 [Candidatus Acidoferrales bacterium]|nr:hypothetical protein [Candidatus Acidoferrales bacterium]
MNSNIVKIIVLGTLALSVAWHAKAQDAKSPYPSIAPIDQYLMGRDAEIALARSAAPPSISKDAEVLVFGPHGYETAIKGKNGFACLVERSWTGLNFLGNDPEFWNFKSRFPICYNPTAARFFVPLTNKKTELALAGQSEAQIIAGVRAYGKDGLPPLAPGGMCYMMSKGAYLGDGIDNAPHMMFYVPQGTDWGGGSPGSPVSQGPRNLAGPPEPVDVFVILSPKWSDGTPR